MRYKRLSVEGATAVISLDLEEDHAGLTPTLKYEALSRLPELVGWFSDLKIPLTIFVAGNFLEKQGDSIRPLTYPEYHSHGYWHPPHEAAWDTPVREQNIRDGLRTYEAFFKKKSLGYRAGCGILKEDDFAILAEHGVQFDSSFFTGLHVSGFHLFRSAAPRWYPEKAIIEIPISAHPFFRQPLSMSYLNLMGIPLFSLPARVGLGLSPLNFNFHLHDLVKTSTQNDMSSFWQWIYRSDKGYALFRRWIEMLRDQQVTFLGMNDLAARLRAHV